MNETRIIGDAIGPDLAVRAVDRTVSSPHAHHATAIYLGVDCDVTIETPGAPPICGAVVMIPPDLEHRERAPGLSIGMVFDPERYPTVAQYARASTPRIERAIAARIQGLARASSASLERSEVLSGIALELAGFFRDPAPKKDRRVEHALEVLRDPERDPRELELLRISKPHLRALFQRDVGISMRTFQLWQRLIRATTRLPKLDATRAAHEAGFADLAHFSRTCRRMLGHSPSQVWRARSRELSYVASR